MQKPQKKSVVGSDGAAAGAPQEIFSLFQLSKISKLYKTAQT